MNTVMNLNDNLAKEFNNCICYECSGINGNGKKTFRIYNSLYELKNHCINSHNGSQDKCIINYRLLKGFVEIEIKKDAFSYMNKIEDLIKDDIDDIKKRIKGGNGSIVNNYFNNKNLIIKIYGENVRTLNETNRALLSNMLDNENIDFILLNEYNTRKSKFNMSGYKIDLSNNKEVGIIYRDIYYLNNISDDLEDEYSLIIVENTINGNFI